MNFKVKAQRSLDIQWAKPMLKLLLENDWSLYPKFEQFLDNSNYRTINRDQWWSIFKFSQEDLSNYDLAEGSCALLSFLQLTIYKNL